MSTLNKNELEKILGLRNKYIQEAVNNSSEFEYLDNLCNELNLPDTLFNKSVDYVLDWYIFYEKNNSLDKTYNKITSLQEGTIYLFSAYKKRLEVLNKCDD